MVNRARTAILVITAQTAVALLISLGAWFVVDRHAGLSALTGGAICVLTTGLFSARVLLGAMEWSPERFLGRFYLAEIQKLMLTAVLLLAALLWLDLAKLPLMLAFSGGWLANWLVLLFNV